MAKVESPRVQAQLSLEKALEFAGDNSTYQKQQLLLLALPTLALAVLTLKMTFISTPALLFFLALSAASQFFLPLYTFLPSSALAMSLCALLAALTYPFSAFLSTLAFCGMGFFGRGLFAASLLHLNEVGGERFRAWSMLVVFAIWGGASLLTSLEGMGVPAWVWVYLMVILPTLTGSYLFLPRWRPTPVWLAARGKYEQARQVLNEIAAVNGRPQLPYALEGEKTREGQDADNQWGAEKWGVLLGPSLRGITLRVLGVWVLREYVYFGSLLLLVGLGEDYSKNFILVSISETVAVLMSYPLRLKIRRVNAFLGLTIAVGLASAVASFAVVSEQCRGKGEVCGAKSVQRIGLMIIRFAIALMGNLLVSYTLQVYPVEVRHTALGMCVGVSSVGSLLLPWINAAVMELGLSGFIPFTLAAVVAIYFILQLGETYGRMNNQKLAELDNKIPLLSLQNWTALNL